MTASHRRPICFRCGQPILAHEMATVLRAAPLLLIHWRCRRPTDPKPTQGTTLSGDKLN